jgi:hypothetical protein
VTGKPYAVVHYTEIQPIRPSHWSAQPPSDEIEWRPIRHFFGIGAFGVNLMAVREAGGKIVGDHDETGEGSGRHEELYVVLRGCICFTVADDTFSAEVGTLVFVHDPAARRSAVAETDDALLLVVGGRPGEPYKVSEWEQRYLGPERHAPHDE